MALTRRKRGASIAAVVALFGSLLVGMSTASAQPTGGAVAGLTSIRLQVGGVNGIPDDAEMAALHVGVARSAGPGFVTVWPCDGQPPTVSSVNYQAGQVVQSLVLAKLDDSGAVCLFVRDTTDVIIDVAGYVPAGSDLRALDTPTRIVDTRSSTPVGARQEVRVPVRGRNGVAPDAGGVGFTLTALRGAAPGFATVYPCGTPRPESSSVNWAPGQVVPNFVIANIGESGEVCVWALEQVDIIVDLVAWTPENANGLELLSRPSRVLDTRNGTGSSERPFASEESRPIEVEAPDGAVAVIGNLTAARQSGPGFATVYPCGVAVPKTASLNWTSSIPAMNSSLGALGAGGEPCLYSRHPTHLIYDVAGFITSTDFYTPLTPFRLYDSREGWQPTCPIVPIRVGDEIVMYRGDGTIDDDPRIPAPAGVEGALRLTGDCSAVIARHQFTGELLRISVTSGAVTVLGAMASGATTFDLDRDDRAVVVELEFEDGADFAAPGNRRLVVRDALTGDVRWQSGYERMTSSFPQLVGSAVSLDGDHAALIATGGNGFEMLTADRRTGETIRWDLSNYQHVSGLHLAPDGRSFVVNGEEQIQEGDQPPELYKTFRVVSADGVVLRTGAVRSLYPIAAMYRGNGHLLACTAAGAFDEIMFADVSVIEWFVEFGFSSDPHSPAGLGCLTTLSD